MLRTLWKCNDQKEAGFTLIELLLALTLFSLVVIGGLRLYYYSNNAFVKGTVQSEVQTEAQLVLNRITNDLRLAHSVEIIDAASIPTHTPPAGNDDQIDNHYLFVQDGTVFFKVNDLTWPLTNVGTDISEFGMSFHQVNGGSEEATNDLIQIKIWSENPQVDYELSTNVRALNLRLDGVSGLPSANAIAYTKTFSPEEFEQIDDRRCFIATAVYGGDSPATNILRTFRDRFLIPNSMGRVIVNSYYKHSPYIAKIIKNSNFLQGFTSLLMLPIVFLAYLAVNSGALITFSCFILLLLLFFMFKANGWRRLK